MDPDLKTSPQIAHISQPVNHCLNQSNAVPLLSLPLDTLLLQFTDQLNNRPDKLKHNLMRSSWCPPNTENSFRIQKATMHCSSLYPFKIQNPSLQDNHPATISSTFFSCPYSKSRNKSTHRSHLNWSSRSLFLHCLKSINQSSLSLLSLPLDTHPLQFADLPNKIPDSLKHNLTHHNNYVFMQCIPQIIEVPPWQ
jgi:hypothetical protein